jgi:hypothetical protein
MRVRNAPVFVDCLLGTVVSNTVIGHHRRRLRRLDRLDALDHGADLVRLDLFGCNDDQVMCHVSLPLFVVLPGYPKNLAPNPAPQRASRVALPRP